MYKITYIDNHKEVVIDAKENENLRDLLLKNGLSPYGKISKKLNCGGRGICATCGVYLIKENIAPIHWHDKLAKYFGYPRLTCQIRINKNLTIMQPPNKIFWGQLFPRIKN